MNTDEVRAAGEAQAQAFHDGMEAGMKAGVDLMREAMLQRLTTLEGETALFAGVIRALKDDLSRVDPFKLYDPNH